MRSIWSSLFCLSVLLITTNLHAQSYENVPTENERKADSRYQRFPGWNTIEFIRNSVINEKLIKIPDTTDWSNGINFSDLQWLQLQNLDLDMRGIGVKDGIVSIPFYVDLRFAEKGNPLAQGTLNTSGLILVAVSEEQIQDITVVKFHTSSNLEEAGRNFGITSKYDASFVRGVVQPTLRQYLWFSDELKKLVRDRSKIQIN